MNETFIPQFFRDKRIWILWRLEKDSKGRLTKVPYQPNGRKASSTDPKTWNYYSECVKALSQASFSGLGVVLSEDLGCIFVDVDHCIHPETGELSDIAEDILRAFKNTYAEISPSGTGLHIFVLGKIPKSFKNSKYGVEMYSKGRYSTFTGDCIQACELIRQQSGLDYVFGKYKTADQQIRRDSPVTMKCTKSDEEIISKIMSNQKTADLYSGKWQNHKASQSEADQSLCSAIAFWCDRDPAVIDRIFRSSGLMRSKWDEQRGEFTYGEKTILQAVAYNRLSITEWKRRKNDETAKCILSEF